MAETYFCFPFLLCELRKGKEKNAVRFYLVFIMTWENWLYFCLPFCLCELRKGKRKKYAFIYFLYFFIMKWKNDKQKGGNYTDSVEKSDNIDKWENVFMHLKY